MNIRTRFLTIYTTRGGGWFRLFGRGFGWKNTQIIPLLFSERNGYRKHLMLGRFSIAYLSKD